MTTQYTSILKLALPVQGELSGTWGDVVNDNITSMVEEAIAGRAVINTWTTNSHTLTSANGTTSESRCAMLEFTDTGTALSGDATVICPTAAKIYICKNDAGQKVTIKTAAGTGVAIADGQTMFVFCDGTNVVEAVTSMSSLKLGTVATSVQVTAILDEDNMASDSATSLATQQSIKAYVDSQVTAQDLDFAGDTGTGAVDLDSQSLTIAGTSNEIETSASGQTLTVGLPSAVTVTTSVTTPTVQVTDVKANDGTAAVSIANTTGQTTITDAVLTTADINAGTIDNTTIGATTASTGAFTTITSSGNTTVSGTLITDTIAEETATAGVTVDGVLLKDNGITATGNISFDGGTIKLDGNYPVGTGNVALGDQAGDALATGGNYNVAIGDSALSAITTGDQNVAIGASALPIVTGNANTAVGWNAGLVLTTGTVNTAIGGTALSNLVSGTHNVAVGRDAGLNLGDEIVATAIVSGVNYTIQTTGTTDFTLIGAADSNPGTTFTATGAGTGTGTASANANYNTLLGHASGYLIVGGSKNSVLGRFSGNQNTIDIRNSDNNIVLSDGDGNPRLAYVNANAELVINEQSAAVDFRVESNDKTHMLFVDAGSNHVNIGGTGTDHGGLLNMDAPDGSFIVMNGTSNNKGFINWESNGFTFYTNGPVEGLRIGSSETVVNEDGRDYDFRVESDTDQYAFYINGANGGVQMGGSSDYTSSIGADGDGRLGLVNTGNGHAGISMFRSDTTISGGNVLGQISAYNDDTTGNTITELARIEMAADGTFNVGDNPTKIVFYNTEDGTETLREVGKFDNAGIFKVTKGAEFNTGATATTSSDFKVSSDTKSGMFFVDASAEQVVITGGGSISGPSNYRFVSYADGTAGRSVFTHAAGDGGVVISGSAAGSQAALIFGNNWSTNGSAFSEEWRILMDGSDDSLNFQYDGGTDAFSMSNAGKATFIRSVTAPSLLSTYYSGDTTSYDSTGALKHCMYHYYIAAPSVQQYRKIAELPVSSGVTGEKLKIRVFISALQESDYYEYDIVMGQRNNFAAMLFNAQGTTDSYRAVAGIKCYEQTDGTTDVYMWTASGAGYYYGFSAECWADGFAETATLIQTDDVTNTSSTPSGTLVFDSTNDTYHKTRFYVAEGAIVANDGAQDIDFRVETDTYSDAIYVNGSSGEVNFDGARANFGGLNATSADGEVNMGLIKLRNSNTTSGEFLSIDCEGTTAGQSMAHYWYDGAYRNRFQVAGNTSETIVNESGLDVDFRVESNDQAEAIFVDAFANHVIIGGTSANITNPLAYFGNVHTGSQHFALGHTAVSSTAAVQYINRQSSDGVAIEFRRVNNPVGDISLTTSGTTYNTTSDRRLKTDIQPIEHATDMVMAMNPVSHKWIADPDADAVHGFIAQEMQEIVPEAVSGDPDGEEMMSMDYGRITPVLVAALQDAHNKIAALETRLAELEAN